MHGASFAHSIIAANVICRIGNQLGGKSCQAFLNGMRVTIPQTKRRTYTDVSIACSPFEWDDELPDTLLNPRVVIEILSPSTHHFDHINKLVWYRRVPSVTDFVMIDSEAMHVQHMWRVDEGD